MLSQIPEDRHWWFASRTRAILSLLPVEIGADRALVLDVGCGAGNMNHHLAPFGRVFGVDNFARPLAVARERGHDVAVGGAAALPVPNNRFALVAALDLVEHCDDDLAVLRECARACAPGGRVVVTVPAFPWLWSDNDQLNGHRRRYRARELRAKVESAGLRVERLTYNNFAIFPPAALLILLRRRGGGAPVLAAPATDAEAYQVEMEPASAPVNAVLDWLGRVEAAAIRRFGLPAGTGLICVARKESR